VSDVALGESLAALSRFFVGDRTLEETLQRVTDLTMRAVPAADLVGVTMIVEGEKRTAVFTDPIAYEIDRAQYETGEGPCLDAFDSQRIVAIASTLQDGPYRAFRQRAAEHGIRSTLSFPMVVEDRSVGALNLYSRKERGFNERDQEVGPLFASQAAIVLANAHAYWDVRNLSARLTEAQRSRAVIEQAKGMLMAAQKCNEGDAFELLVKASQRENIKLREIALRIVNNAINGESHVDQWGLA
jgi:GAF domain-containing protein